MTKPWFSSEGLEAGAGKRPRSKDIVPIKAPAACRVEPVVGWRGGSGPVGRAGAPTTAPTSAQAMERAG